MIRVIVILIFLFNLQVCLSQDVYNAVLSSSPSGRYIIATNLSTDAKSIFDLETETEIYSLPKKLIHNFAVWSGDTVLYYAEKEKGQEFVKVYNVKRKKEITLNVINTELLSELTSVAFPNFITDNQEPFIICRNSSKDGTTTFYSDHTILYKFYPLVNKVEQLCDVNKLLGEVSLETVAVNPEGNKLIVTIEEEAIVKLYQLDLVNEPKAILIDESEKIDRLHAFYLKDDNFFVYFKEYKDKASEVLFYDLKKKQSHVLDTLQEGEVPIYSVDVPLKRSLLITYLNLKEPIEIGITESETPASSIVKVLGEWATTMFSRSSFLQVDYNDYLLQNIATKN